jgi:hypothetical protein
VTEGVATMLDTGVYRLNTGMGRIDGSGTDETSRERLSDVSARDLEG